jgi:hypothetical protein
MVVRVRARCMVAKQAYATLIQYFVIKYAMLHIYEQLRVELNLKRQSTYGPGEKPGQICLMWP